jgi:hypothetical protein
MISPFTSILFCRLFDQLGSLQDREKTRAIPTLTAHNSDC